jgi:hypothetical protein
MRPLSVPELLTVWERGLAARPFERALAILSVASPESSPAALPLMSIGRRDASLLQLREWAFGSELAILAACPRCHQPLEMDLSIADLSVPAEDAGDSETSLAYEDYEIRCRPPNSEDLAACVGLDMAMSRQRLFGRCVIESRYQGEPVAAEQLPEQIAQAVIERIAEADPQADTRVDLTCPDCNYRWDEVFDIASFFWTEIDSWARRILREVHILASAYGWREGDILALSPMRRQIYLTMAAT